jgi:lactoylglutathione lyase
MQIEHIAVWTHDLERLKMFYENYFQAIAGKKYINAERRFESYFLTFVADARLELMQMPGIPLSNNSVDSQCSGYIHLAFSIGSQVQVNALTARLKEDGYRIVDEPRRTGDGYYESCVLDPDGNRIEITV